MVEFALILPLFILLLFGILDFGRAIYGYNTINNAAREGARWAIVDQTVADIQATAAQHSVALGIADSDVEVEFVNNATGAVCTTLGTASAAACSAVVRVPYQYTAVTPVINALVGVIQMTGESQFKIEVNCREPGPVQCPAGS